jgi:hypothetical protein
LINYNPPEYMPQSEGLRDQVKGFLDYWRTFFVYQKKWTADSQSADPSPFSTIPSATILPVSRKVQAVSGSVTVQTISALPSFSPFVILAVDGFSTGTSGNISAAVTVAPGTAIHFYYHPVLQKWFPEP